MGCAVGCHRRKGKSGPADKSTFPSFPGLNLFLALQLNSFSSPSPAPEIPSSPSSAVNITAGSLREDQSAIILYFLPPDLLLSCAPWSRSHFLVPRDSASSSNPLAYLPPVAGRGCLTRRLGRLEDYHSVRHGHAIFDCDDSFLDGTAFLAAVDFNIRQPVTELCKIAA